MRSICIYFLGMLFLLPAGLLANPIQTPEMQRLLQERETLVKDYTFFNAQNSNFWGKKSKKDLLQIIETLKGIIQKDSEIIGQVSAQVVRKEAALTVNAQKLDIEAVDQRNALQDRVHQLTQEIANHESLAKARQRQIGDLQTELRDARQSRYTRDRVLFGISGLLVLVSGYLFYSRTRRPKRKRRRKTANS